MSNLSAIGHIAGSVVAVFVLGFLMFLLGEWENERNKKQKRVLKEAAAKFGVAADALNDEGLSDRTVQFLYERSSNELLRNRISDLCGLLLNIWFIFGLLLQVGILGAVVWFTFTDDRETALVAWFAPGVSVFFWVATSLFSLLCYVLTGRYPGEAKHAREAIAEFLNEHRTIGANDVYR